MHKYEHESSTTYELRTATTRVFCSVNCRTGRLLPTARIRTRFYPPSSRRTRLSWDRYSYDTGTVRGTLILLRVLVRSQLALVGTQLIALSTSISTTYSTKSGNGNNK
eukprot:scaffold448704_cov22-Prasinocladus_malaysianus.AAC.1